MLAYDQAAIDSCVRGRDWSNSVNQSGKQWADNKANRLTIIQVVDLMVYKEVRRLSLADSRGMLMCLIFSVYYHDSLCAR